MESISTPSPPSATSTSDESAHLTTSLLFSIVVGVCRKNGGIGFKNKLPWPYIAKDMKWFSKITSTVPFSRPKMPSEVLFQSGLSELYESVLAEESKTDKTSEFNLDGDKKKAKMNAVIMGRKTWESIPNPPLASRINVVVTSQSSMEGTYKWPVHTAGSLEKALDLLDS